MRGRTSREDAIDWAEQMHIWCIIVQAPAGQQ
jgi:hypothetical protein